MYDSPNAVSDTDSAQEERSLRSRFTAWPLWASVAGVLGILGTLIFDVRPPAETEAWQSGTDYTVSSADMDTISYLDNRLGWMAGILAVAALITFAAYWWRSTQKFERSAAAKGVALSVVATASVLLLGYGWKGALANYIGPELGTYDEAGLYVYYMLTDFGAYLPWFGVAFAAIAVAWMAFVERLVSRVLGTVSALFGVAVTAIAFLTGVPGIPGTLMQGWLVIAGVWLAIGKSRATAS